MRAWEMESNPQNPSAHARTPLLANVLPREQRPPRHVLRIARESQARSFSNHREEPVARDHDSPSHTALAVSRETAPGRPCLTRFHAHREHTHNSMPSRRGSPASDGIAQRRFWWGGRARKSNITSMAHGGSARKKRRADWRDNPMSLCVARDGGGQRWTSSVSAYSMMQCDAKGKTNGVRYAAPLMRGRYSCAR